MEYLQPEYALYQQTPPPTPPTPKKEEKKTEENKQIKRQEQNNIPTNNSHQGWSDHHQNHQEIFPYFYLAKIKCFCLILLVKLLQFILTAKTVLPISTTEMLPVTMHLPPEYAPHPWELTTPLGRGWALHHWTTLCGPETNKGKENAKSSILMYCVWTINDPV